MEAKRNKKEGNCKKIRERIEMKYMCVYVCVCLCVCVFRRRK